MGSSSHAEKEGLQTEKQPPEPNEWRYFWLSIFGFFILLSETGVRNMGTVLPFCSRLTIFVILLGCLLLVHSHRLVVVLIWLANLLSRYQRAITAFISILTAPFDLMPNMPHTSSNIVSMETVMNVFVPSLIEEFNCTKTQADTAAIAMPSAASLMAGPIAAIVYQYFGARVSICTGALLCFGGFILGSFATSINFLYAYGLIIGFGCALMRNSVISVQCEYFIKNRNVAMAFISIGPGIGVFVLPRLIVPIVGSFTWNFAFQLLSVLYLVCFFMGLFITRMPSTRAHTFAQLTGVRVWLKAEFLLHIAASFCASAVCIIYVSNILVLMRSENIDEPEHVYSYQGIASIFGRALLTVIMGACKVHIAFIMIINYAIAQTSLFSAAFCYTIWEFRAQNFFSGVGIGMFQATLAPFLLAIVGPSQLPGALGYSNLINGIAAFAAINAGGYVSRKWDTRAPFYLSIVLGSLAVFFAVVTSILLLVRDKSRRKPSISQMENADELRALKHISASE